MIKGVVTIFGVIIMVATIVLSVVAFAWVVLKVGDWVHRRHQIKRLERARKEPPA